MSQGYYGSICLNDALDGKIMKGRDGKSYIRLDDLTSSPFQRSEKNGKTYINIGIWINDEDDQYGQCAGISLSQSKEQREKNEKKKYVGNLRRNKTSPATTQAPTSTPATGQTNLSDDDLPF